MRQDWEAHWEDYYEILQVHPSAEPEVIAAAYKRLTAKYHPDHNPNPDADDKTKKFNIAYGVLSDPEKCKLYHEAWLKKKGGKLAGSSPRSILPKPIIDPPGIVFKNMKPGEIKKTSFLIINTGGPYTKIHISNPDSWLKILDWHSISKNDELPLKVNIIAQADNSGKKRSENIYVALDDIQTHVTVILEARIHMQIEDHNWHDVEFENLNRWAQGQFNSGNTELKGRIFRYRLNHMTGKYQFRLRHSYKSAVYAP